jgi:hypothetical protein
MKNYIIKLTLSGVVVHVNASRIVYYYAKKEDNGQIATVIYLDKGWGIEVSETPDQIDALISQNAPII